MQTTLSIKDLLEAALEEKCEKENGYYHVTDRDLCEIASSLKVDIREFVKECIHNSFDVW
jgi:hypothetical protein